MSPNVLARDLTADAPNEKWVKGDVKFVPTGEGLLYVAKMVDLYRREVVGKAMGESNDQILTERALNMALGAHDPSPGLIHHSDRGSAYKAGDYGEILAGRSIVCSTSQRKDC